MQFERPNPHPHRSVKNTRDERGTVKVMVILSNPKAGGWAPIKGNIVRTMSIAKAKVSDVFQAVERAIFPDAP